MRSFFLSGKSRIKHTIDAGIYGIERSKGIFAAGKLDVLVSRFQKTARSKKRTSDWTAFLVRTCLKCQSMSSLWHSRTTYDKDKLWIGIGYIYIYKYVCVIVCLSIRGPRDLTPQNPLQCLGVPVCKWPVGSVKFLGWEEWRVSAGNPSWINKSTTWRPFLFKTECIWSIIFWLVVSAHFKT